jgi:hypothetical protein
VEKIVMHAKLQSENVMEEEYYRPRRRWNNNIEMNLEEIVCE